MSHNNISDDGAVAISKCNTLTPQIKGNHGATNHMFLSVPGQHHDVALCARAAS